MVSEISIKVEERKVTGIVKRNFVALAAAIANMLVDKADFRVLVFAAVNKVILDDDAIMQEWNEVQLATAQTNEMFKQK